MFYSCYWSKYLSCPQLSSSPLYPQCWTSKKILLCYSSSVNSSFTSSTRFSTLSSEQSSLSFSIKLSNWSTKSSPNTNNTIQEVLGLIQKLKQVTAWTCKMYKYVNEHNFVQVLVFIICIKESELPVFELLVSSINYLQLQGKINVRKLELYLHILHKVVTVLQIMVMFGISTKRINAIIHTLFGNIRKKSVLFMEITN